MGVRFRWWVVAGGTRHTGDLGRCISGRSGSCGSSSILALAETRGSPSYIRIHLPFAFRALRPQNESASIEFLQTQYIPVRSGTITSYRHFLVLAALSRGPARAVPNSRPVRSCCTNVTYCNKGRASACLPCRPRSSTSSSYKCRLQPLITRASSTLSLASRALPGLCHRHPTTSTRLLGRARFQQSLLQLDAARSSSPAKWHSK